MNAEQLKRRAGELAAAFEVTVCVMSEHGAPQSLIEETRDNITILRAVAGGQLALLEDGMNLWTPTNVPDADALVIQGGEE